MIEIGVQQIEIIPSEVEIQLPISFRDNVDRGTGKPEEKADVTADNNKWSDVEDDDNNKPEEGADVTGDHEADIALNNLGEKSFSSLTAGTITSQAITLAITEGAGDVKIQAGKTDFGDDTTSGFILGIDDSDSNKPKFEIGSSATKVLKYDGTDVTLIGGVITAGTVRTAATGVRVEMQGSNNRIEIFNASASLGYFGSEGVNGNFLYCNQPDTNQDFPPIYVTSAQDSNVFNIINTNSGIAHRPAVRVESNNTNSNSPALYVTNTGASGYGIKGVADNHSIIGDAGMKLYLQYMNTYFSVDSSGDLYWHRGDANRGVMTSAKTTGSQTSPNGTLQIVVAGTTYYLLTAASLN